MKRLLLVIFCATLSLAGVAQNTRTVKGMVFDQNDVPLSGAVVKSTTTDQSVQTGASGAFELQVATHVKHLSASLEGYFTTQLEVDGSYLIFKLKIDKKYAENKAKAEAAARLAAQQEAEAKAKAEEAARIAAEKEAAAKAKAEEAARIAAEKEAAAKAKAEEAARIAAEKEAAAKAKAEEAARIAAEKEAAAKAKAEEAARIAAEKEAAAKAKAEEAARVVAEKEVAAKAEETAQKAQLVSVKGGNEVNTTVSSQQAQTVEDGRITLAKKSGYFSTVELSFFTPIKDSYSSDVANACYKYIGVNYIGGYQFKGQDYLGVGLGVNFDPTFDGGTYELYDPNFGYTDFTMPRQDLIVPVYLYYRHNFVAKRRVSPFLACSLGGFFSTPASAQFDYYDRFKYSSCGILATPQFGLDMALTDKLNMYFSIGLNCYTAYRYQGVAAVDNIPVYPTIIALEKRLLTGLDFHVGFTF